MHSVACVGNSSIVFLRFLRSVNVVNNITSDVLIRYFYLIIISSYAVFKVHNDVSDKTIGFRASHLIV